MSATLTWASSGLATKTGTTINTLLDDLDTLVTSKAGDATFFWQKASKSSAATPFYLVLKPKDGSAGRILLLCYTSAPAGSNTAIFDTAAATNVLFCAFFPAGNVDTPSNLTASSGTILGDDTGVVKCGPAMNISAIYAASVQVFYFDSAEAMAFGFQNPAAAGAGFVAAGKIIVDSSDVAYSAVMSFGTSLSSSFGASASPAMPFSVSTLNAGAAAAAGYLRTNYGSSNRLYFQAWMPSAVWGNVAVSSTDILTDTSNSKAWFVPVQLLGQVKGEGFVIKLRQIAMGPGTTGALAPYNTTGPVVVARQANVLTTGGNAYPWMVNFKL
jgi:hypothetical protein